MTSTQRCQGLSESHCRLLGMLLLTVARAVARLHQQLHLFSVQWADPLHQQPRHLQAAPLQDFAWERVVPQVRVEALDLSCRTSVLSELLGRLAPAEVPFPLDHREQEPPVELQKLWIALAVARLH